MCLREVAYSVLCCIFLYLFVGYSAPSCAGDQTCTLRGSIAAAAVHTKPCSPGFEAEGRGNRMEKEEMPLQETGARNSAMRLCTFFVHRVRMYVQIITHTCQLNHARHGTNSDVFNQHNFSSSPQKKLTNSLSSKHHLVVNDRVLQMVVNL